MCKTLWPWALGLMLAAALPASAQQPAAIPKIELDEAVRRAPGMAELYENRAVALAALQRHDEALRDRAEASRLLSAA